MLFVAITLLALFIAVLIVVFLEERRQQIRRSPLGTVGRVWGGRERRQNLRVPVVLSANYTLRDGPDREERSRVWNVSDAGVAVVVSEKLQPGTWLDLKITIADTEPPLCLSGCVTWTKSLARRDAEGRRMFESGVSLTDLGEAERQRFDRFVKTLRHKVP